MITNNEIKLLKSLSQKKYRYQHKQFVVEGLRIIEELIKSNQKPLRIWTTKDFLSDNSEFKKKITQFNYDIIHEKYFSQILDTKNPQHIMALLPINLPATPLTLSGQNILILDGVADPGNMGSLLRSAAWYGINTVICSDQCVDIYNPKVIRSGMGAHFYILNIMNVNLINIIDTLKKQKYNIISATLDGISYKEMNIMDHPWGLILGSEAHGISNDLDHLIDQKISIPTSGHIESLNVAVAGSILLDRLIHEK